MRKIIIALGLAVVIIFSGIYVYAKSPGFGRGHMMGYCFGTDRGHGMW